MGQPRTDNFKINAPKVHDARYYKDGISIPYASKQEAFDLIYYKAKKLTCAVIINGVETECWYKDAYASPNDLVAKTNLPPVLLSNISPDVVKKNGNLRYDIIVDGSGKLSSYTKVTKWWDGSDMTPQKADGIYYIRIVTNGTTEYFRSNMFLDARDFGVVDNLLSDSSSQLQQAIDVLPKNAIETDETGLSMSPARGGLIQLPKGKIAIASSLLGGHEVWIRGENKNSTTIFSYISNDALLKNTPEGVYSTGGLKITDLRIDGRLAGVGASGILVEKADELEISRVAVMNFSKNGIELNKAQLATINNVTVKGCGDWGIKLGTSDGYPCNNASFNQVYVTLNDKGVLNSGSSNQLARCTFQANVTRNLVIGLDVPGLEPTMGTKITACHFEYNANCYDIDINAGCLQTTIDTCQFYPSGAKTKRFISNSGDSTVVKNCGNQTDDLIINGSRKLIQQNVDSGSIQVEGGKFGVYASVENIVAPFYIGAAQTDEAMAVKLPFRCRVTTNYDNDRNEHRNFGSTLHLTSASDGFGAIYDPFTYQTFILNYFGLFFGNGSSQPTKGILYRGGNNVGTTDTSSWLVAGARCTTSAAPAACLIIGDFYIWADDSNNLRLLKGSFPTSSTSGKRVVLEDGVDVVLKSLVIHNDVNTPSIYVSSNAGTTGDLLSLSVNNVSKAYVRASGAAYFAGTVEGDDAILDSHLTTLRQVNSLLPVTGIATRSGDGSLTSFSIPHGLGNTPDFFMAQGGSAAAKNISFVTADATDITVNYDVAPTVGVNNISIIWQAKLSTIDI